MDSILDAQSAMAIYRFVTALVYAFEHFRPFVQQTLKSSTI